MLRYEKGALSEIPNDMPAEYPLKLTVNSREIATLVSSPHELRFLVAGFLRTQGFVSEAGDILAMGVCEESGEASVRIRGEIPERLTPVLSSGCGTGITFSFNAGEPKSAPPEAGFSPEAVFSMMQEMAQLSVRYGRHGGIHSAAVSDGTRILLHAEDLGRHNTIDRLAGYVRSESFRIAACPERLLMAVQTRFTDVAGVILVGGKSRRMGRNKALLEVHGERMIETAYRRMAELFDEVLLVTNTPESYDFIPCRKIVDIYPDMGPLGGIHAALSSSAAERAFITACDMPGLNSRLIRELCSIQGGGDVVIPETPGGLEPLHAVYARSCLQKMEKMLRSGERRILSFFDLAQVRLVPRGRIAALDPDYASFRNINTPEDYRLLAQSDRTSQP